MNSNTLELTVSHMTAIIGAAMFFINIAVLLIGGTWKMSRLETALKDAIGQNRTEFEARMAQARTEYDARMAKLAEDALRLELRFGEHYVRRESFYQVADGLKAEFGVHAAHTEARMVRMEEKIDRLTERAA